MLLGGVTRSPAEQPFAPDSDLRTHAMADDKRKPRIPGFDADTAQTRAGSQPRFAAAEDDAPANVVHEGGTRQSEGPAKDRSD